MLKLVECFEIWADWTDLPTGAEIVYNSGDFEYQMTRSWPIQSPDRITPKWCWTEHFIQELSNASVEFAWAQIRGRCLPTAPIDGVGVHSKKTQERQTLCAASSLLATCFWPVYRFQLLPSATPPLGIVDHAHHSNIFFLFSALRRRCVSAWFLINWKRQLRTDQYARVAQSTSYDVNFGASKTSSSLADRITGTNFYFYFRHKRNTRCYV